MTLSEFITTVITAGVFGGLAGQSLNAFLQHRFTSNRDLNNWRRSERLKAYSKFVSATSSITSRESIDDFPDEIRVLSQRIHLLFDEGTAPKEIADSMQKLFYLALDKKWDRIKDDKKWRKDLREEVRAIRKLFATTLKS